MLCQEVSGKHVWATLGTSRLAWVQNVCFLIAPPVPRRDVARTFPFVTST